MSDAEPEFEVQDNLGETKQYNGNVGTSNTSVPTIAGNYIEHIYVEATDLTASKDLLVSWDGGTTFKTLVRRRPTFFSFIRGDVTQLVIKSSTGTSDYEITIHHGKA